MVEQMLNRDWPREDLPVLCDPAKWLLQIQEAGFFSQVGSSLTKEQYDQALEALTQLYETFQATMSPVHYSSPSARAQHFCLDLAWEAAQFRLKALLILRQPVPPPLPPPKKKPLTPEQTVAYLEEVINQSSSETYLGDTPDEPEPKEP